MDLSSKIAKLVQQKNLTYFFSYEQNFPLYQLQLYAKFINSSKQFVKTLCQQMAK